MIRITFNPEIISYRKILEIFGKCHDPTTLNRQGADVGTQYRSTIMYLNDQQLKTAEEWKKNLNDKLASPVVTEIVPAPVFYKVANITKITMSETQTKVIVIS